MGFAEDGAGTLGRMIKQGRKAKEMSQEDLAASLGVTQPSVSAWESGKTVPTVPILSALARILGLDGSDVLAAAAVETPASSTV